MSSNYTEDFVITYNRLIELALLDIDVINDEEWVHNPTDYAMVTSIKLLRELYKVLYTQFPRGFSGCESRGGIDLMWEDRNQDKQVWILVKHSPEFPSSVYYRQGDNSQLIKEPPPHINLLGKLLIWLSNDNDLYSIKQEL